MRNRMIVVFLAGMLCCAVFLGAAAGTFLVLKDDAQAQNFSETWQVYQMPPPAGIAWSLAEFEFWVNRISVACDIVPANQDNMYLYRCPAS